MRGGGRGSPSSASLKSAGVRPNKKSEFPAPSFKNKNLKHLYFHADRETCLFIRQHSWGKAVKEKQACYRRLKKYKYQLMNDYSLQITIKPLKSIETKFVSLNSYGILTIKKGYAWDGPSGPTMDTPSFMRGSLVHDALYQLMRTEHLDYKLYRQEADKILRRICLLDGMWPFRAWYVYKSVQIFGEKNARPQPEMQDEIICVP